MGDSKNHPQSIKALALKVAVGGESAQQRLFFLGARDDHWGIAPSQVAQGERASLKWEPSLLFGAKAVGASPEMTATETMHIEAHKGQLFASFGKWMSPEFVKKQGNLGLALGDFLVCQLDIIFLIFCRMIHSSPPNMGD
jgi:hypothetical protein